MTTLLDHIRAKHGLAADAPLGVHQSVADGWRSVREDSLLTVTAIANTAAVDLMDEVVVPEGCEMSNG